MAGKKPSGESKPWDRLPHEGDGPWACFQAYLSLAKPREYESAADLIGVRKKTIYTYSSKFGWKKRSAAYDDWMAKRKMKAAAEAELAVARRSILQEAEEREKSRQKQLQVSDALISVATRELHRRALQIKLLHEKEEAEGRVSMKKMISDGDVVRMISEGVKIARAVHEFVDPAAQEEQPQDVDLSALTDEQLDQLDEIAKVAPGVVGGRRG